MSRPPFQLQRLATITRQAKNNREYITVLFSTIKDFLKEDNLNDDVFVSCVARLMDFLKIDNGCGSNSCACPYLAVCDNWGALLREENGKRLATALELLTKVGRKFPECLLLHIGQLNDVARRALESETLAEYRWGLEMTLTFVSHIFESAMTGHHQIYPFPKIHCRHRFDNRTLDSMKSQHLPLLITTDMIQKLCSNLQKGVNQSVRIVVMAERAALRLLLMLFHQGIYHSVKPDLLNLLAEDQLCPTLLSLSYASIASQNLQRLRVINEAIFAYLIATPTAMKRFLQEETTKAHDAYKDSLSGSEGAHGLSEVLYFLNVWFYAASADVQFRLQTLEWLQSPDLIGTLKNELQRDSWEKLDAYCMCCQLCARAFGEPLNSANQRPSDAEHKKDLDDFRQFLLDSDLIQSAREGTAVLTEAVINTPVPTQPEVNETSIIELDKILNLLCSDLCLLSFLAYLIQDNPELVRKCEEDGFMEELVKMVLTAAPQLTAFTNVTCRNMGARLFQEMLTLLDVFLYHKCNRQQQTADKVFLRNGVAEKLVKAFGYTEEISKTEVPDQLVLVKSSLQGLLYLKHYVENTLIKEECPNSALVIRSQIGKSLEKQQKLLARARNEVDDCLANGTGIADDKMLRDLEYADRFEQQLMD